MGINKVNVCNDVLKTVYTDIKNSSLIGNDVYDLWPMVTESIKEFIKKEIDITGLIPAFDSRVVSKRDQIVYIAFSSE